MHVLVVEDDPDMLSLIKAGLETASHEVTTCRTAERALEVVRGQAFDLLLLDVELPGRDGLSVLQEVRQRKSHVPVIIITGGRTSTVDRVPELLARIRAVRRRAEDAGAVELRVGDIELHPIRRVARRGGVELALTAREFDVLEYLMRRAGEVVSRDQLAMEVWRQTRRATSMDNVIDVHISHLRQKLEARGASAPIQTVRGAGFVLQP